MPWLSALGGLPAIADDTREHYEAAAQATLDMADEDESVAALIAHLDVDVRAARGLLADMLGSRDQWLPLLGSGGDVDQLLSSLDNAIERSEEHTSELQSLMRISYAVFCLKKKNNNTRQNQIQT